jgi:uncharacterized protein YdaL
MRKIHSLSLGLLAAALAACATPPAGPNGPSSVGQPPVIVPPIVPAIVPPTVPPIRPPGVLILHSNLSNAPYPYTDLGKTYATFVANLVGRYPDLEITIKGIDAYTLGEAQQSVRTFYIGSTYDEPVPEALETDIAAGAPVTWINDNLWRLNATTAAKLGLKFVALHAAYTPDEYNTTFNTIQYKGYGYTKFLAPMEINEVRVTAQTNPPAPGATLSSPAPSSPAPTSTGTSSPVIQAYAVNPKGAKIPYLVQSGNFYFVADNPFTYMHETDRYVAFTDMLGPMLGHTETCEPRAVARVEDLSPTNSVATVGAMMNSLKKLDAPFAVATIPEYVNATTTPATRVSWTNRPLMLEQLRRAPSLGGVVFQHGYTHQFEALKNPNGISGEDWEFWDRTRQAPILGMTTASALERIATGQKILTDLGVNPIGWTTPHYAADPALYRAFGTIYDRVWERRLYQNGTIRAGQFFTYPLRDTYGSLVIPENLGNIQANNLPAKILENARANRNLRCPWAGVFFHPYLLEPTYGGADKITPASFERLIGDLQAMGYRFVNPATVAP